MTCSNCGQPSVRIRRSTRAFGKGPENIIVIENVPVISCRNCGMDFISAATLEQIEQLRAHRMEAPRYSIPVATFQDREDDMLTELAEAAA